MLPRSVEPSLPVCCLPADPWPACRLASGRFEGRIGMGLGSAPSEAATRKTYWLAHCELILQWRSSAGRRQTLTTSRQLASCHEKNNGDAENASLARQVRAPHQLVACAQAWVYMYRCAEGDKPTQRVGARPSNHLPPSFAICLNRFLR